MSIIRPDQHTIDVMRQTMTRQFKPLKPKGGFRVLLIDPPWRFNTRSDKGLGKSAERHYPTLSIEEIRAIPIDVLAADDCVCFVWVTWPLMPMWMSVIEEWGFRYSSLAWEWIKFNPETGKYAFSTGYTTRKNLEPCLLITKGSPQLRTTVFVEWLGY